MTVRIRASKTRQLTASELAETGRLFRRRRKFRLFYFLATRSGWCDRRRRLALASSANGVLRRRRESLAAVRRSVAGFELGVARALRRKRASLALEHVVLIVFALAIASGDPPASVRHPATDVLVRDRVRQVGHVVAVFGVQLRFLDEAVDSALLKVAPFFRFGVARVRIVQDVGIFVRLAQEVDDVRLLRRAFDDVL